MRHLETIAPQTRVLDAGPRVQVTAMPGPLQIIEGATGLTPFELQGSHVNQETAEAVAGKYPEIYRIAGKEICAN